MRRIKHNLGRLPQVRMGHHRMPDAVLGIGLAGAIAVGTLLPVSQAIASPSSHRADAAAVTTADAQDAGRDGDQAASRSENREPVQQDQPQDQGQQDQAQQDQQAEQDKQAAEQKAEQDKQAAEQKAEQDKQAAEQKAQQEKQAAEEQAKAEQAAAPAKKTYPNNLDGWIEEARDVLAANGKHVPSARAMHAAAIAESGGNPNAQNNWDSNAKKGTPSIGLTQVIMPTFKVYALPGHTDIRNPVDNLIASSRYCDARYGNMDNMAAARGYGSHWRGY
ncbi:transglycosylase SLT domain-containing protein [Kitasatospora sp. NA04385]|uniref:transglycosylase SLT domain-containing protein n=1 Tax=Kitasatospora sp. NA04385 TaxID=2742135 RepID=UPI001590F363|nr:transglycosylase SLT domain-containing protein [Kitasatospora sp. NA04385]QKW18572.1 transglycosylase SLT domain-containing protein [Kitasatospora sp. NA04385]